MKMEPIHPIHMANLMMKMISDKNSMHFPFMQGKFYIDKHTLRYNTAREWAILQDTKYGPKLFDTYFTKEQAETAAKYYNLDI